MTRNVSPVIAAHDADISVGRALHGGARPLLSDRRMAALMNLRGREFREALVRVCRMLRARRESLNCGELARLFTFDDSASEQGARARRFVVREYYREEYLSRRAEGTVVLRTEVVSILTAYVCAERLLCHRSGAIAQTKSSTMKALIRWPVATAVSERISSRRPLTLTRLFSRAVDLVTSAWRGLARALAFGLDVPRYVPCHRLFERVGVSPTGLGPIPSAAN